MRALIIINNIITHNVVHDARGLPAVIESELRINCNNLVDQSWA